MARWHKATRRGCHRPGHGTKGVTLMQEKRTTRACATGAERLQTDADAMLIIGNQYGRWTVIAFGERSDKGKRQFQCECQCGTIKDVAWSSLKRETSRSCGCLRAELPHPNKTHGLSRKHPLYSLWLNMRGRCNSPRHKRYADWGGRGIRVCDRWNKDFLAFIEDVYAEIGPKPGPEYSLDRIDNDGNYEPGNVRWATALEQNRNKRRYRNQWTA